MWPDTRLCDLLKIEHPIIQAPMVGSCTPALASAVSNSGGLGSLGLGERPLAEFEDLIKELRTSTNRPFNLNFFVRQRANTSPETLSRVRERLKPWYEELAIGEPPEELPEIGPSFDSQRLQFLLDLRPAVVSFHFGIPEPDAMEALKGAGITLLCSATNVTEAKRLEAAGIHAIIAQGWEAGGHQGTHIPRAPAESIGGFALIPQIADAVSVPVIAAGGIADGRGIAAAFALGASGVQLGTAFLSCPEAGTDEPRRQFLRQATDNDTMMTDAYSGRAARAMRSRFAQEMERNREPVADFGQMYALSGPIRDVADDKDASFHLYGQSAALNREIPASQLVSQLANEAFEVMKNLVSQ